MRGQHNSLRKSTMHCLIVEDDFSGCFVCFEYQINGNILDFSTPQFVSAIAKDICKRIW